MSSTLHSGSSGSSSFAQRESIARMRPARSARSSIEVAGVGSSGRSDAIWQRLTAARRGRHRVAQTRAVATWLPRLDGLSSIPRQVAAPPGTAQTASTCRNPFRIPRKPATCLMKAKSPGFRFRSRWGRPLRPRSLRRRLRERGDQRRAGFAREVRATRRHVERGV